MLAFATDIPVSNEKQIGDLLAVCRTWILGSPHTRLTNAHFPLEGAERWSRSERDEVLTVAQFSSSTFSLGGLRYVKLEDQLEWTTEIVGIKKKSLYRVSVRVACESSTTSTKMPEPRKPYIIRQILDTLGGGLDGDIGVSAAPIVLRETEIGFAADLIMGRTESRLPLVYVSAQRDGSTFLNVRNLAMWLSGMAHVAIEPSRSFSSRLMTSVASRNVYGGAVGIYWPESAGRHVRFYPSNYEDPREMERDVISEVRVALTNRRQDKFCSWAFLDECLARDALDKLKAAGSTEINNYVSAFDGELRAKDDQLKEAEREIARLQSEVRALEAKNSSEVGGSLLASGSERDLYLGERKDLLLDVLKHASSNLPEGSRRQHIIDDVLRANKEAGERSVLEDEIKTALRSYRTLDAKTRAVLEEAGFSITEDGKHYKAIFRSDPRYTFILPKTSSDVRAGKNLASDITKVLF